MQNIYLEVQKKLLSLSEEKYKEISIKFTPNINGNKVLGVRIPKLRDLAKNVVKTDKWSEYIKFNKNTYFEEITFEGLLIGYVKIGIEEKIKYMTKFVKKIDNWATCDIFCSTLKFKNDKEILWDFILPYSKSEKEFEIRFFSVMAMNFFLEDKYVNEVLRLFDNIKTTYYYAQMGIAWALSVSYIKFPDITIEYLKNCNLDKFIYNKSLQKIIESYRVSDENKILIKSMKRI